MVSVRLDTKGIHDWNSFHLKCKEVFGFPDFYGMNMDAWIDCLTYVREGDGMSRFRLEENEMLDIEVTDLTKFKYSVPEIFDALVECSAFVNSRYQKPVIALVFTEPDLARKE